MKSRLQKSIDYIKGFCEKHDACDFCRLQDKETKICTLRDAIPIEWKYQETEKEDGNVD